MILSGELCFRLKGASAGELSEFLSLDCNSRIQAEHFGAQTETLASLRNSFQSSHCARVAHDGSSLKASIAASVSSPLGSVECENYRALREFQRIQQRTDSELMREVQRYFAVVRDELTHSRQKLNRETSDCRKQLQLAKTLRDVRIFAHHLYHETRGKVAVTVLPPESAQFKRCKKAIKDNVSSHFMTENGYRSVKVRSVLKLENSLISDNLQKLAYSIDNGKVKGLFCAVPRGGLHALCAYGLHAHVLAATDQAPGLQDAAVSFKELFQAPWFRTGVRGMSTAIDAARAGPGSDGRCTAETMVHESLPHFARGASLYGSESAGMPTYQFSRQCTVSSISMDEKELEGEGVFVALCRVLVSKTRTINTPHPSPQEIKDSCLNGFDAIYSTSSDEYLLLRPEFALPEFVMQIYFEKEAKGEDDEKEKHHHKNERATPTEETWAPSSLLVTSRNYDKHVPTSSTDSSTATPTLGELLLGNSAAAAATTTTTTTDTPAHPQNVIANVESIMKRACRELRAITQNLHRQAL